MHFLNSSSLIFVVALRDRISYSQRWPLICYVVKDSLVSWYPWLHLPSAGLQVCMRIHSASVFRHTPGSCSLGDFVNSEAGVRAAAWCSAWVCSISKMLLRQLKLSRAFPSLLCFLPFSSRDTHTKENTQNMYAFFWAFVKSLTTCFTSTNTTCIHIWMC